MNETETLNASFEYLDGLSKSDYESESLTGHGKNFLNLLNL